MSKYLSIPDELLPLIEKRDSQADRRARDRRAHKSPTRRGKAGGDRRLGLDMRSKKRRKSDKK